LKLLVLGATGGTGREIVTQALEQSHETTVFVRNPEPLQDLRKNIRVLTGDVTDEGPALPRAIAGQDLVISALGVGKSFKSRGLIGRTAPLIVNAMAKEGVRRLLFVSAYGVGATWRDVPVFPRVLMRLLLSDIYRDKEDGEKHVLQSDLDWTVIYPVTLTNGGTTGKYRVGERLSLGGFPTISRADVAHFLLKEVSVHTYSRKRILISY
jgi:putative NADH-flavin reductase